MKIEVITDDAFSRLEALSANATCIRAVMAYWTILAEDLPPKFLQGLRSPEGFLCVDIHNPTSIDALASLKIAGVDVCLHLVSTTGKSEIEDSVGMPNHLMHSKVIIFDYAGSNSVIWVGSHNGTFRALNGINFECSLAVSTSPESDLYQDVLAHMTEVRNDSQSFSIDLVDHCRFLQGSKLENAVSVMEFENENDQPLALNEEITIFNMSRDDFKSCKTVDSGVYVSVHGAKEILYSARVVQTGETPAVRDQSFSDRRYANRSKTDLPVLLGSTAVTKEMYQKGTYYAIVKVEKKVDELCHLLELPTDSAWVNLPPSGNIRLESLDANQSKLAHQRMRKIKGLTFKVPAFQEMMNAENTESFELADFQSLAFKEIGLEQKRAIKRPALIRKKLLVRR